MTNEELREQVNRLIDNGDEGALQKFVLENFTELPENTQKDVLLAFYEQTLKKEAEKSPIAKIQVEGLRALDKLEDLKEELESK